MSLVDFLKDAGKRAMWYMSDEAVITVMAPEGKSWEYDLKTAKETALSQEDRDALVAGVMKLPASKGNPTMYKRAMTLLAKGELVNEVQEMEIPFFVRDYRPFMELLQRVVRQAMF